MGAGLPVWADANHSAKMGANRSAQNLAMAAEPPAPVCVSQGAGRIARETAETGAEIHAQTIVRPTVEKRARTPASEMP